MKFILSVFFSLASLLGIGQSVVIGDYGANPDKALLTDMSLQMELADAVNSMYNFKFDAAEKEFRYIKYRYPKHPLPYFLIGLSNWWKIMPNIDNTRYDKTFMAYMDSTIVMAERLYDKNENNYEAKFFLSAAYGFKSRLHSERKNWRLAASDGEESLDYLNLNVAKEELGVEFLFGDALYNYYAEWVPENYPLLKPILFFFPDGDRAKGIQQLREVANNAFYTRTEAQYYLMRILALDENKPFEALRISEYLHKTYPDNPYFHRYHARMLYTTGQYNRLETVAQDLLSKIDSSQVGYEAISGRYAAFYLGQLYDVRNQHDLAKAYFKRAISFAESTDDEDSGYMLYSLIALGDIAKEDGNRQEAKRYYQQVKKYGKRKQSAHEKARERLRAL
jgi:hypothetical protein